MIKKLNFFCSSFFVNKNYHNKVIFLWFIFLLSFGGLLSVFLNQDDNYDYRQYHLHNAWAFFNKPLEDYLLNAGMQTYLHPLLDLPHYLLAFKLFPTSPRLVAFIMGLPFGLILFLISVIAYKCLRLHGVSDKGRAYLYSLLVLLFSASGAALLPQVGTTTNEIYVSCFVLGGVAVFFLLSPRKPFLAALSFGALSGISCGLKLTAISYVLPALLGLLIFIPEWKAKRNAFLGFCSAWWVFFLPLYGWWGLKVYALTGNPFFPLSNNIFKSDWMPHEPWGNLVSHMPSGIAQAVFFPFYWINDFTICEPGFTDIRFLLAYSVFIIFGLNFIFRKFFSGKEKKSSPWSKSESNIVISKALFFFLIFLPLSFLAWELRFSILRYAIPMETLLGIFIFLQLLWIFRVMEKPSRHLLVAGLFLFLTIAAFATTKYPRWGRVAYGEKVLSVKSPVLPKNSLILLVGRTTSFIIPELAKNNNDAAFIGILREVVLSKDYVLGKKIAEKIKAHRGPVFAIVCREYSFTNDTAVFDDQVNNNDAALLTPFGVSLDLARSWEISTNTRSSFVMYHAISQSNAEAVSTWNGFLKDNLIPESNSVRYDNPFAFGLGWAAKGKGFRWSMDEKSLVLFRPLPSLTDAKKILIKGSTSGKQSAKVTLNGIILFSGQLPETGDWEMSLPPGALNTNGERINLLEFFWPEAQLQYGQFGWLKQAFSFTELQLN